MNLKEKISDQLKTAMKTKDTARLSVLRVLKSEIERNEQSSKGKIELSDVDIPKVIKKMVAGVKETTKDPIELEVLEAYLPQQLSEDKIKEIIDLLSVKDMSTIMKHFSANYTGQYDGKMLSDIVRKLN